MNERTQDLDQLSPDRLQSLPASDLADLATAIRNDLIQTVGRSGGHLGVNLGVVELTLALHRVLDLADDSLVFDIGHQVYTHKLLTGRRRGLAEINSDGGVAPYADADESPFDRVTSSHAGASIGLALGIAVAKQRTGRPGISVAVIGDGAMVEGSSFEALNHAAIESVPLMIVLNDNEMALDRNVGGLHEYLKTRQVGDVSPESLFTALGFDYEGPFDGHDVVGLSQHFRKIKDRLVRPVIVHVKTIKGKGLDALAAGSPTRLHWTYPIDTASGHLNFHFPGAYYPMAAGAAVSGILKDHPDAVMICPGAMQVAGVYPTFATFPDRCIDVGMAEQHSLTLAAGMALERVRPIVVLEATFMPRAFDQLAHDVCVNNLPVLMLFSCSGHAGRHHRTHHSLNDMAYLRSVPNLRIVHPQSHRTLPTSVRREFEGLRAPTILLYPTGFSDEDPEYDSLEDVAVTDGFSAIDLLLVAVGGPMLKLAHSVKQQLADMGLLRATVVAATEISHVPHAFIQAVAGCDKVVTFEEGYREGGYGSALLAWLSDQRAKTDLLRIGFDKTLIEPGSRPYVYQRHGFTSAGVVRQIRERWGES